MTLDTEDTRHRWHALRRHLLPAAYRTGLDAERVGDFNDQPAAPNTELRS